VEEDELAENEAIVGRALEKTKEFVETRLETQPQFD